MNDQRNSPNLLEAQVDNQKYIYFGCVFPFLPDFIYDHMLVGNSDTEKLQEVFSRFTQIIISLRKWKNCSFSLRYISNPDCGEVGIFLIGRFIDNPKNVINFDFLLNEFSALLKTFNLSPVLLNNKQIMNILMPFQEEPTIFEVRQHEEIIQFTDWNRDVYVVHPFWKAKGNWILPLETMLRQPNKVTINIYLESTTLTEDEKVGFSEAAKIAQTLSDQEIRTYSDTSIRRRRDPQAEVVAKIYGKLVRVLVDPYILVIQVASMDNSSSEAVARAIGATITTREESELENDKELLPSAFDIRTPSNQVERKSSLLLFRFMKFIAWGNELAISGNKHDKSRLVYLVGNQGASCGFRFPISIRGGVPGVMVRQSPPDFEPGPRPTKIRDEEIHLGNFQRGGLATIKIKDLSRHTLVTGFTGSGKTNTVLYLLDQLWAKRKLHQQKPIPFLVIEAAKKEYRGLANLSGFEDLLVFTLGDETTSPFRLNPFELQYNVRLEAHLGKLQNCFDAALPQFGILPSIIAESMERIYLDKGWNLGDICSNSYDKKFPTLNDLSKMVLEVSNERGYAGENSQNIRAAVSGRINSLLRGSKGKMFTTQFSIPFEMIMNYPTVLELNDLNQQDKAITMMFLLMLLREYREQNKSEELQHITVIEEAHNVLENVRSVGASEIAADTRAKAVEAFASMLSEVRAYGEGLIISDQSPEKLSPDAIRNTNLQIAHQLRHKLDRNAIASAMIMDQFQQDYLGKLGVGTAALYFTGFDKATFIQVPNYKKSVGFQDISDHKIITHMESFKQKNINLFLPYEGCGFCNSKCLYQKEIESILKKDPFNEEFTNSLSRFGRHKKKEEQLHNWLSIVSICKKTEKLIGVSNEIDVGWCYFVHKINFSFTPYMRKQFENAYKNKDYFDRSLLNGRSI